MKQLTCEMCGSTDLMKQNGVFVCQTCGMKYSVEEAKKMIIEGTVNVKIDESEKLNNYLALAKSADEGNNYKELESYCDKALVIDPRNYEAWFLKGKAIFSLTVYDDSIDHTYSEATICFKNATLYAPDYKKTEINDEINSELYPFFVMRADFIGRCFTDNPSEFESTYIYFMEQMQMRFLVY